MLLLIELRLNADVGVAVQILTKNHCKQAEIEEESPFLSRGAAVFTVQSAVIVLRHYSFCEVCLPHVFLF